jgi:hypothetical protein
VKDMGWWARRKVLGLALLLLAGGCAGEAAGEAAGEPWQPPAGGNPAGARWADEIVVDRDTGALSAPGFNALIDAESPGWAASPRSAAAELLDLDRPFDGPVKIHLAEEDAVVTVTFTGLGDDSVEAERYRVEFEAGADGRHRFVSGAWSQRCHEGRGHQRFAAKTCS